MTMMLFSEAKECDFCSLSYCNLGIQNLEQISGKFLEDILQDESGKKQRIGNKVKEQNDRYLRHIFNLGKGFEKEKFNNLALDKLRKDKQKESELGNKVFDVKISV